MSEALIKLENIVTRFGEQVIHDHINLDVQSGEILGVVGGSGMGKSVLLREMLGLRQVEGGRVLYQNTDIARLPPRSLKSLRRNWGVLFQNGALYSSLTVGENIAVPMREHLTLPKYLEQEVVELKVRLVGLPLNVLNKYPSQLSGGMVKRVALARALALDPPVVFLDEPTAGLDPISAAAFDDLILYLQKNLKLTVVMVTHDLDSLFRLCDRIAVLVDKKVICDTLERVTKHPHPWIQDYFHGIRGRTMVK